MVLFLVLVLSSFCFLFYFESLLSCLVSSVLLPLVPICPDLSADLADCLPVKPKRSSLNQLTRTLLRNYDSGVRPVHNWTSTTTIYIDLILQSVLEVDGKTQSITTSIWCRQMWRDEFLVWDPEEFDGINEISLSSDALWVPDVIVSEFVKEGKSPPIPYVYVNSSGSVKNYRPIQAVLACSLEMYAFPFDKQNCSLTFRSWLHSVNEIDLALWRSADAIANDKREFMNDGEWELLSIPSQYRQISQDNTDYSQIQFNLLIRRRPLLYVVGLLIPSIFLMLVDVVSFYLPLDSGMRIAFKISILLGYTVFRVNLTDDLPASAVKTPLIGVFFVACKAMLMLSLTKSILVVKLLHHTIVCNVFPLCTDFDVDYSLEEDLLSLNEIQEVPSGLERLLQELVSLRLGFAQEDSESLARSEWLSLCLRLDCLLFRFYLFVLALYTSTLLLLWASWSFA
uniref:5-hydroxytryptamine (serotonin) receptor 3B n=1 Tax=Oryzias latipes TaxID=8090 RepID=A0A3P9KLN6_ORYLA